MEIPSKYDPALTEEKWYAYWMSRGFFRSVPDPEREPYTIVIPPPNVTGVLHMGHMLNNTIQDVLIRRARMLGKNALWVPGTDHASIATEAKVVGMLREQGIKKSDLTREEFLKHAWEWKEKHGGIILEQLKKLGASCDWERTKFTMDPEMSESVIRVFVDLYRKGYIYRGQRMVNWDPQAKTAISDEEVIYKEVASKLYYLEYKIAGGGGGVTIATTRPETILGDTAVCVHPDDPRYKNLIGRKVLVPLIDREVPVIADEYVDREFGTGVLKITPAHDENDYEIGLKHGLEVIDIFNEDGTLNEAAQIFTGEERFAVRDKIVDLLREKGHLVKIEDYTNKVGFSERTDVVIEPRLSLQWFLRMKELAEPALKNVLNNEIRLVPGKFKNTYRHWMENIRDWCISRQLWWGHRIPAWYIPGTGDYVVAETVEEAVQLAREQSGNQDLQAGDLRQDEDVLDTWFSSWLWPISVFDGIRNPENPDYKYYYPTDDLVTAPEILFFWVARMIIAGYEYAGEKPFKNVYLTGIVRDKQRRKMSKSLGNSPEPLELIRKYGADGVRVGMLLCSPAGGDLLFDESLTEQGRNFGNKIWNAFRLVQGMPSDDSLEQPAYCAQATKWFGEMLNASKQKLQDQFDEYRLSEALMTVYRLFWDEFSAWYLEAIKPQPGQPVDGITRARTLEFMEELIRLLHPFMPFITEEIWHLIRERKEEDCIINAPWPPVEAYDIKCISRFEKTKEAVTQIRTIRKNDSIANKVPLTLHILQDEEQFDTRYLDVLKKLANLEQVTFISEKPGNARSFIVGTTEYYVPLAAEMDIEAEVARLQNELEYARGFLKSVEKKLSNERFIQNAPEPVVARERAKQSDAESRIRSLEEQLLHLKNNQ